MRTYCSSSAFSSSFFSLRKNGNYRFNSPLLETHKPFPKSFKCLHSLPPDLRLPSRSNSFSCSAITFSPSQTTPLPRRTLKELITEFQSIPESLDRVKRLIHYASLLVPFPDAARNDSNRVMGCTARVWVDAQMGDDGKMRFWADSDSDLTKGYCACLLSLVDGSAPEEVLRLKAADLTALNVGPASGHRSRANTWQNVLVTMQKKTRAFVAQREGKPSFEPFPSLVVTAEGVQAKGSYAEAQAKYLFPNKSQVDELVTVLKEKKIGVVAHFYMDPEVQGVLTGAQKYWPHIYISDSLVMADTAVKMARAGCKFITVLGVDFMSENVRAILDQAGFGEVGVYRMSNESIGCSLADAAATPAYMKYLEEASGSSPSLHVIYINTSLETKAYAHELVPTITCTSSNVVQTILQAFSQIPELTLWYGPDSYMGANIQELFRQMALMSDDEIAEMHPSHNRRSIEKLLHRLHYYQDGTCIVHHLFGHDVVEKLSELYSDAFLTAHLEVPGEMFSLAMESKGRGMGVVGSTQNILDFIKERVQEAIGRDVSEQLQFVLGTESGMVTSIVAAVRNLLNSVKSSSGSKVSVEIVFPVSSESMMKMPSSSSAGQDSPKLGGLVLPVIPGVASGEGCSIHGGCASCPYMKMNSLSSLLKVCQHIGNEKTVLGAYEAERFKLQTPQGKLIADVGCRPILHMRHFQAKKELPEELVHQILHPQVCLSKHN